MVEVTRKNFEELLPDIAEKIENATFLTFDAEYTGIYSDELKSSYSLFDTAQQRYEKSKENVSRFVACQYGLAIFKKDRDENLYRVATYNFYLFPVSFESFAKRDTISCQISCINFLTRHEFDFNKFFKEGVPYLNKEKADNLRTYLMANRNFMHTAEHLDPDYFPQKINPLCDEDIDEIINRLAGFSKIFDVIHETRKPIIGHNCLMDLLLSYHLFWANLPDSYEEFKTAIHNLFPLVYDTKHLSRQVKDIRRRCNREEHLLDDSNLFALYTNTYSIFEINMPLVETQGLSRTKYHEALMAGRKQNLESLPDTLCHSADFDALVTGCVFLNLCYLASRPKSKPEYRKGLPPTFSELLGKTECFSNKINMARAIISHIHLAGSDPEPHRPNWILVKSYGKFLDPVKLKLELVQYGDLEINPLNESEVLIACGSLNCHRRVWNDLKKRGCDLTEKCFNQPTSFISKLSRETVVGVIVLGVGVVAGVLFKWLKSNS